jgi:hypothetical protein
MKESDICYYIQRINSELNRLDELHRMCSKRSSIRISNLKTSNDHNLSSQLYRQYAWEALMFYFHDGGRYLVVKMFNGVPTC